MNFDTRGFKIGDRVFGRNTGCSSPSTVIGLIHAEATPADRPRWDELFPDWKDNMVAICKYDTPQKNVSFDEFESQIQDINDGFLQAIKDDKQLMFAYYNKILPSVEIISYPIEDLM